MFISVYDNLQPPPPQKNKQTDLSGSVLSRLTWRSTPNPSAVVEIHVISQLMIAEDYITATDDKDLRSGIWEHSFIICVGLRHEKNVDQLLAVRFSPKAMLEKCVFSLIRQEK